MIFFASAIVFFCCLQAELLGYLHRSDSASIWVYAFMQCFGSYCGMLVFDPKVAFEFHFSPNAALQTIYYFSSIFTPAAAFLVDSNCGAITMATLFRSSALVFNLLIRNDRSIFRWFGALLISIGLAFAFVMLQSLPNQIESSLFSCCFSLMLICIGSLSGVLLGIEQEKQIPEESTMYAAATMAFFFLAGPTHILSTISRFSVSLYFILSMVCAILLKVFWHANRERLFSFNLTRLLTIRRFITVLVGSLSRNHREGWILLESAILVGMGAWISEI